MKCCSWLKSPETSVLHSHSDLQQKATDGVSDPGKGSVHPSHTPLCRGRKWVCVIHLCWWSLFIGTDCLHIQLLIMSNIYVVYTVYIHIVFVKNIPAEELCAAWCDFKGETLSSVDAVVLLAVAAAGHMTRGLARGAGKSCGRYGDIVTNPTHRVSLCPTVNASPMTELVQVCVCVCVFHGNV